MPHDTRCTGSVAQYSDLGFVASQRALKDSWRQQHPAIIEADRTASSRKQCAARMQRSRGTRARNTAVLRLLPLLLPLRPAAKWRSYGAESSASSSSYGAAAAERGSSICGCHVLEDLVVARLAII
jgi:hypothetical protein